MKAAFIVHLQHDWLPVAAAVLSLKEMTPTEAKC